MKKILVVEDEIPLQKLYKTELERAGYEVHVVFDGKTALKKIKTTAIDLMILDIRIPGEDGLAVLSTIKSNPAMAGLPVIIVSVFSDPQLIDSAKRMGAADFIVKVDFSMADLIKRISLIFPEPHLGTN